MTPRTQVGPITIVAHMSCPDGAEQTIVNEAPQFIADTRAEAGCIDFFLHQRIDDRTKFVWYENFADQSAVDEHVKSDHVTRWFGLIDRLGAQNSYELYSRLGP